MVLKELDIGVEKVTLGDVDILGAQLVNELENSGSDGGFADSRYVGEGAERRLILEDNAIELRDVELVGGGA